MVWYVYNNCELVCTKTWRQNSIPFPIIAAQLIKQMTFTFIGADICQEHLQLVPENLRAHKGKFVLFNTNSTQ